MQELKKRMSELGFDPPTLELDGEIHRFQRNGKGDSGWYIGWLNTSVRHGHTYEVALFGDWRTREEYTYKPAEKLSREDQAAIKIQIDSAAKKFADEKIKKQKQASEKAEKLWASAAEIAESPYLDRKKLTALYGAKSFVADFGRAILVPMRDRNGTLWGAQRIFPDGSKRFLSGQRVDGCFHSIGDFETDSPLLICEGFATGATLHEATGYPVAVAFNAGNLASVALELRKDFPERAFMICGDDDQWTVNQKTGEPDNVGRAKAGKAAMLSQAATVFPEFIDTETHPTDFNDLHCLEGIDSVKRLFIQPPAPAVGFIPLGHDDGTHFYYSVVMKDIVRVTTYSEVQLFQLAALEYWVERYPSKNGIAWQKAKDELIQLCKKLGPFDIGRIRGTGVWLDDGKVIVNTGHSLIVNGTPMPLNGFRSWYVYVQTKKRMPALRTDPLSAAECMPLIEAVEAVKWNAGSQSGYFLAGWLAIARIAGALPIRPHIWLTGPAAAGKSTIMDRIVAPCLGGPAGKIFAQGGTTEAGIRQELRASSVPVVFDEFESTNPQTAERNASIVELLRQTWSQTQGAILKGSSGGGAITYQLAFAALVSSIRMTLDNDADRSRFAILEMKPHGSDRAHWQRLKSKLDLLDQEFGERLFARSCAMLPTILESQAILADAFMSMGIGQRMAQQFGMLLAGYWSLISDEPPSKETALAAVKEIDLSSEKRDSELTDEIECLNHLMTTRITIRDGNGMVERTIGEIITSKNPQDQKFLKTYGIAVLNQGIVVSNCHSALTKIYSSTKWQKNWSVPLGRLPNVKRGERVHYAGQRSRGTLIPYSVFADSTNKDSALPLDSFG